MVRDIKVVGKELAIDIVSLNKKIDAKAHNQIERLRQWEGVIKKHDQRIHKVMKQYNSVNHQLRKLESGTTNVEKKLDISHDG
jgi:septal ring factor EnvC (AmiA/AmiB activator)